MKTNHPLTKWIVLLALSTFTTFYMAQPSTGFTQGTALTYQGRLNDGANPANGTYDLRFAIYDAGSGGNLIAGPVTNSATAVTNGLFTVTLDFGNGVFTGNPRWLEIAARTNGAANFTILAPRQQLTPTPYAIMSGAASNLLGTLPAVQLSGTLALAQLPSAALTNGESGSVTFNGSLTLPNTGTMPDTIYSGSSILLRADNLQNFFAGVNAGNATLSGNLNTAIGYYSLTSDTSGAYNVALGSFALRFNTSGFANTAIGYGTMEDNTGGFYNTAYGCSALFTNTTGSYNIALGYQAGYNLTTGNYNIDIGNPGVAGESGTIRIGTPGTHTNTFIAGVINGNGGGLTNLNAAGLTGAASNFTLTGSLYLPPSADTIYSGNSTLLRADNSTNFFAGTSAGNLTLTGEENTGIGVLALQNDTSGSWNTAIGEAALYANTTGYYNVANGLWALYSNVGGSFNTANGVSALGNNTSGSYNVALGYGAGYNLTSGSNNIDVGNFGVAGESGIIRIGTPGTHTNTFIAGVINGNGAGLTNLNAASLTGSISNLTLVGNFYLPVTTNNVGIIYSGSNTLIHADGNGNFFAGSGAGNLTMTGYGGNTAVGYQALPVNINGDMNTACGLRALYFNTSGEENTAIGVWALENNTNGSCNTADGLSALNFNTSGSYNTASGFGALSSNTIGSFNIAMGTAAGGNLTTGSNNIDIGNQGAAGESGIIRIGTTNVQTATYIAGISGVTISPVGAAVYVNSSGQLGTVNSSRRFKEAIQDMGDRSDVLLSLRPVAFRYKHDLDPQGTPQFGLIAEEVEKVAPELVLHDAQGQVYSVRYEQVNAMLLNEFQKEHRKVEEQNAEMQSLEQENQSLEKRLTELEALVNKPAQTGK